MAPPFRYSDEEEYDSEDTSTQYITTTTVEHRRLARDHDHRRRPSTWRPLTPVPSQQRQVFNQSSEWDFYDDVEGDLSSLPLDYGSRRPSEFLVGSSDEEGDEDEFEPLYEDVQFEFIGPRIVIDDIADEFSPGENLPEMCTLCLENHDPANDHSHVVLKACGHVFCRTCLDGMANGPNTCINTCPNCRVVLFRKRKKRPILAP
ncbi:hypothetical protein BU16DRAFT_566146 [Lophium mytilinum]|uniref:RING-type domain-containing protein n=1 Tax=Lophium mytilinum TaxID=390894 RepID=A0A6A6QGR1_9PEZI|nr:hypothetical protein BU16DRAFT_566146 [Lophium mytilinum]